MTTLLSTFRLPLVRLVGGDNFATGGVSFLFNGFVTINSNTITATSTVFFSYFGALSGYGRLYLYSIVPGVSFTIASTNTDDVTAITWFFILESSSVLHTPKAYNLLALDAVNRSYGTITLSSGHATVNTPYALSGYPIIITPVSAAPTLNTVYTVFSISSGTSFTIKSTEPTDSNTISYFIFAPNSSAGTVNGAQINYPLLNTAADARTYGISQLTNNLASIQTYSVTAESIPIASPRYPVPNNKPLGLLYYDGATPGDEIFFAADAVPQASYPISWMFLEPS